MGFSQPLRMQPDRETTVRKKKIFVAECVTVVMF